MVLDNLNESLKSTLKKIKNSLFVDEKLINELVKDIQKALLKSDVNVKLVFEVTKNIKERALKEDTPKRISKKEHLISIVYEELVNILGGEQDFDLKARVATKKKPYKIMLVGLFGSGKTTTTGKLAKFIKKRGFKVAVMSTDTWRPAAAEQLKQISKDIGVDCFIEPSLKDPVKIYKKFEPKLKGYDVLLVDTAGRDALSDELISELDSINTAVVPDEIFLVLSADIGQAAEKQAQTFHEHCGVNGIVITKLDGTAKGGGALIAASVTDAPIRFIGVGEKVDDLELFNPPRFVGRMLGLGDLETLLEKTQEAFSEADVEDIQKRMLKGQFNLIDMYEQMKAMKSMGSLSKIMDMIPGMGGANIPKEMLKGQEEKMESWKYLMESMTKEELESPDLVTSSRLERISKGSGRPASDLRALLKQYKQAKKMMKMLKPGASEKDMQKMMKKMQGMR